MSLADIQYVDVVICGSGSAGLCAGTLLARHGICCKILEKNSGPLELGQADGVQCRTLEVFESLGLEGELLRRAYHVLEVLFGQLIKRASLLGQVGPLIRCPDYRISPMSF
jgi:2-polyprenyl-6-methoxyphenol hydroxylase-like FAD-dependent oxidoreductase